MADCGVCIIGKRSGFFCRWKFIRGKNSEGSINYHRSDKWHLVQVPEAAVSITASIEGKNAISLGNVIGSNIFNLLVVTGACAVLMPITVDRGS